MADFRRSDRPILIPRIVTPDYAGLVAFVKAAFGAEGELLHGQPTDLRIGDSLLMVSDGGGVVGPETAFLYLYVPDCDETYARAVTAGAASVEPPADMPWGDRRATVRDAWGNLWQIGTYAGG